MCDLPLCGQVSSVQKSPRFSKTKSKLTAALKLLLKWWYVDVDVSGRYMAASAQQYHHKLSSIKYRTYIYIPILLAYV